MKIGNYIILGINAKESKQYVISEGTKLQIKYSFKNRVHSVDMHPRNLFYLILGSSFRTADWSDRCFSPRV